MIQNIGLQTFQILPSRLSQIANINPLSLILAVILGAASGYLINYVADVLPETRRLSKPKCRECETPYKDIDYLLLRKCPNCDHKRSARAYIVLGMSLTACILLQFFPFAGLNFLATLPLMLFLGTVLVIDIEHRLVLAETSLIGIFLCLAYGLTLRNPTKTFLGGMNGFLIMLFFFVLGIVFSTIVGKLRGKKISEVAFGFGDVAAGTFLGLLTGWPGIFGVIILALIVFTVFSVLILLGLILSKRYRAFATAQPFVPFLILGAIVMFYL